MSAPQSEADAHRVRSSTTSASRVKLPGICLHSVCELPPPAGSGGLGTAARPIFRPCREGSGRCPPR